MKAPTSEFVNPDLQRFKENRERELAFVSQIVNNYTLEASPAVVSAVQVPLDRTDPLHSRHCENETAHSRTIGNIGNGGIKVSNCFHIVDCNGVDKADDDLSNKIQGPFFGDLFKGAVQNNASQYGVFNPDLLRKYNDVDKVDIALSDEALHPLLGELLEGSMQNDGSAGHVGERLAFDYYRKIPDIDKITWCNENGEIGNPYDLVLHFSDGRQKYCEVKTRFVELPHWANKWFISPKELHFAYEKREDYFLLLICIAVDERRNVFSRAVTIGYERGFEQTAHAKEVSIVLQLNLQQDGDYHGDEKYTIVAP